MSRESFGGSSPIGFSQSGSGRSLHIVDQVSGTQQGPTSFGNGVSLDDLVSGKQPEFHNLISQHASSAFADKAGATKDLAATNEQKLKDLLKKVLEDGVITPQEIAQLKQAISDTGQATGTGSGSGTGAGAGTANGGTTSAGGHHCSHDGHTGVGSGTSATGSDDEPESDDPAPTPATPPAVMPPATPPAPPPAAPPAAPPKPPVVAGTTPATPTGGSFKLGNTNVNLKGGTDAERAKTRTLFEEMYQKDTPFKKGIDSKAASGLNVTIEDLPANIEGQATVGGNTMSLDPQYIGNTNDYANTIAHEFAHNLGMQHGAPLEAFAAEAAAVTA